MFVMTWEQIKPLIPLILSLPARRAPTKGGGGGVLRVKKPIEMNL